MINKDNISYMVQSSRIVSYSFSCPDPEVDKEIVVVNRDGALVRCLYHKKINGDCFWASEKNSIDLAISAKSQGFISGVIKWMYKKDFCRALDIFSKQIIRE